jgi:hypothetical protein
MDTTENVMTTGAAAPSPFRRPAQSKPAPNAWNPRSGAPMPRPRPAPTTPTAPAAAAPGSAAGTIEQPQLERRRRIGARWLYWVAAVSLINTVVAVAGQHWRFIIGLGTTQVATGLAVRAGRGWAPALLLDLVLIGGFVLLGYLALQGQLWALAVGFAVYALDGLIFLAGRNWIGLGFHVFVLVVIFKGLQAAQHLAAGRTEITGLSSSSSPRRARGRYLQL